MTSPTCIYALKGIGAIVLQNYEMIMLWYDMKVDQSYVSTTCHVHNYVKFDDFVASARLMQKGTLLLYQFFLS